MEAEVLGLPRYVVTFLCQMEPYPEYLKWNISEGSHKITLTLTWNFGCPSAGIKRQALLKTGLWTRLQRTLRLPRALDASQGTADGSVPPEIATFLQQTSAERTSAPHAEGNRVPSKTRKLSDTLKEFRSRRRIRSSLSLPDRIMGGSASTPDETRGTAVASTSDRRTATSYPTTPVRSPHVNGYPTELLQPSKTISWPRLGDLLYVADQGRVSRASKARDSTDYTRDTVDRRNLSLFRPETDHIRLPLELKCKPNDRVTTDQPVILIQRASPDRPLFSKDGNGCDQNQGCGGGDKGQRCLSSSVQTPANLETNPALNQTVLKCLDSCDKILFRHSTTIT